MGKRLMGLGLIVGAGILCGYGAMGITGHFSQLNLTHLVQDSLPKETTSLPVIPKDILDRANSLGFQLGVKELNEAQRIEQARRKWRELPQQKLDEFNAMLKRRTIQERIERQRIGLRQVFALRITTFHAVVIVPLEKYTAVPPVHVLDALETAKASNLFDSFSIISIQVQSDQIDIPIHDPLLIGLIGKTMFIIAQWEKDIQL